MTSDKNGKQTIGCRVTSCKHNMSGCDCELSRIEIEPLPYRRTLRRKPLRQL